MKSKLATFQKWLPFEKILNNGLIKLKDNTYIKIIKIFPINYNLKSELEKKVILNSFKVFFKTCNFDMQVLVQSTKEDLSMHILSVEKEQEKKENKEIQKIYKEYINFIKDKSSKSDFSNKNFIIVIKETSKDAEIDLENIKINNLNDKYYKIRECLSKCGNLVTEISKEETIELLYNSFNYSSSK